MSSQHPPSATVCFVPTPAVSYSLCRPNTRRQLQCLSSQDPPSATVSVVPRPSVSFSVCRPKTLRQLQCLSSEHPPSASVCVVPTPAVSYSRSSQHPLSAQCVSSQHPPSATATDPFVDLTSAAVTYASVRSQLRLLLWRNNRTYGPDPVTRRKPHVHLLGPAWVFPVHSLRRQQSSPDSQDEYAYESFHIHSPSPHILFCIPAQSLKNPPVETKIRTSLLPFSAHLHQYDKTLLKKQKNKKQPKNNNKQMKTLGDWICFFEIYRYICRPPCSEL